MFTIRIYLLLILHWMTSLYRKNTESCYSTLSSPMATSKRYIHCTSTAQSGAVKLLISCLLQTCKELGLNTKGMPKGLCLLFYGPSGTGTTVGGCYNYTSGMPDNTSCVGKTMTANAVANYLTKKILLVTVSVMMERDLTKVLLT